MKLASYPYIAVVLGVLLAAVTGYGSGSGTGDAPAIPLLTLLVVAEFGFFVTAIGAWLGIRFARAMNWNRTYLALTAVCTVLAIGFAYTGLQLWPGMTVTQ